MGHYHETDRQRTEWGWMIDCVQCGESFESKRYDASFCTGACRTKHSREEKQLRELIAKVDDKLLEIIEALKGNYNFVAFNGLKALKKQIDRAIENEEEDRDFNRPLQPSVTRSETHLTMNENLTIRT